MPDATALLLAYERLLADLGPPLIAATDPDAMRRRVAACLADAVNVGVLDVDWPDWESGYPGPFDYVWCRDVLDELTETKRDMLWYATRALIDVTKATGRRETIAARDAAGTRVQDYFDARGNDAALAAWTPQTAVNADTVTAGQGQGEGTDRRSVADDDGNRYAALDKLPDAPRTAYLAFSYAEAMNERRLQDRDAWDWLEEHGTDGAGELAGYALPPYDTWARYLRRARNATGEQKYTPRIR